MSKNIKLTPKKSQMYFVLYCKHFQGYDFIRLFQHNELLSALLHIQDAFFGADMTAYEHYEHNLHTDNYLHYSRRCSKI